MAEAFGAAAFRSVGNSPVGPALWCIPVLSFHKEFSEVLIAVVRSGPVRLFLIDDHQIVRAAVRMLVERVDDFTVVGEARDGPGALAAIAENPPDVVIIDLMLSQSELDGLQTIREICRVAPSSRILVLSMHEQPMYVRRAFEAGAHGYTAKVDEWRELVIAVRTLMSGERYLSSTVADWNRSDDRLAILTPRQQEILRLIAEGYRTREIADELHIAVKTVDTHRTQLMQRLNLHNIAELTRFALEVGMISLAPPPVE
jgi:DNA-binding NarL/FixJ family response regulator